MTWKLTTFFLGALLPFHYMAAQIDYAYSNPAPLDPAEICESGLNTDLDLSILITDDGTNGMDTYYEFITDGLNLNGTTAGMIPDGTLSGMSASCNVTAAGLLPGTYIVTLLTSHDPYFGIDVVSHDFEIIVNDEPMANINTPDGTLICDENPVVLDGDAGPDIIADYLWHPTDESTSSIDVTVAVTYELTTSNSCGTSKTDVVMEAGAAPVLTSFNCIGNDNADVLNIFVQVDNPEDMPLTYSWYRNGVQIFDGGDYTITSNQNNGITKLKVDNVMANHFDVEFIAKASNDCGYVTTPSCSSPVAVDFIYFSGLQSNDHVDLSWATASEIDSDYFEIQRSADGQHFEAVDQVAAANFSQTELAYAYQDRSPFDMMQADVLYYRLRQVDLDGSFIYSDMISVSNEASGVLELESLVFDGDQLLMQVFAPTSGWKQFKAFSLSGQQMGEWEAFTPKGNSQLVLEQLNFPAGMYLIHLSDGNRSVTQKVVK